MKKILYILCFSLLAGCSSTNEEHQIYEPSRTESTQLPRINEQLPYEVLLETKEPKEAEEAYLKFYEEGLQQGFTPVIVFDDASGSLRTSIKNIKEENGEFTDYTEHLISQIEHQDVTRYYQLVEEKYADILDSKKETADLGLGDDNIFPGTGYKEEKIFIFKLPTSQQYEVPAYLPFLVGEDIPDASLMSAILKEWQEDYGVILFLMSEHSYQFRITKELSDEDAFALAKQIVLLHPAAMMSSYGSVENIAYNLTETSNHYFMIWY